MTSYVLYVVSLGKELSCELVGFVSTYLQSYTTVLLKKEFVGRSPDCPAISTKGKWNLELVSTIEVGINLHFGGLGMVGRRGRALQIFFCLASTFIMQNRRYTIGRMNRRSTKIVLHIYFTENLGDGLSRQIFFSSCRNHSQGKTR